MVWSHGGVLGNCTSAACGVKVGVGECAKTAHKAGDRGEIGIRD